MAALALVLVGLTLRDLIGRPAGDGPNIDTAEVDPTRRLDLNFDWGKGKGIGNSMRFGLEAVDPDEPNSRDSNKKLTFDQLGRSNSTVGRIDGADRSFGNLQSGKWVGEAKKAGKYSGKEAVFEFTPDRVHVTQTVQIVPGEAYETAPGTGVFKRPLNTCLIKYKVENKDTRSHNVGLRVMIDTYIGNNDGVPFTIPGVGGLVDTFKDFNGHAEIPEFIQALERPDVERPGTVVQMTLKLSKELAPDRVSLTYWPGFEFRNWEVPIRNIGDDSSIVLYWNPRDMKPGTHREMAFSYGLGKVTGGKLGLTFGGTLAVNREMTVVAYVADPKPGETATLKLPAGFEFLGGSPATQNVPAAEKGPDGKTRPSPVTWHVRPTVAGRHTISATTSTGLSVSQPVTIGKKGLF
jgi:hypothetical protein